MRTLTSLEQRALDLNSEYFRVPTSVLMENAGTAVSSELKKRFPSTDGLVLVFAGLGGNGGDALVAARHLKHETKILVLGREDRIRNALVKNNLLRVMDKVVFINTKRELFKEVRGLKPRIIIDGILGTGIRNIIREPASSAIDYINNTKAFKISIDIPSGLDPDTEESHDKAVKANLTVTLHAMKKGLINNRKYTGDIVTKKIGVPRKAETHCGPGDVKLALKPRRKDAHKGDYGRVLIIGGSKTYTGAPALAGLAALRICDLVTITAPKRAADIMASFSPDLITHPLNGDYLSLRHMETIKELEETADVILIGSGLGLEQETKKTVLEIIKETRKPLVVDADALKPLASNLTILKSKKAIITPHANEFETLSGIKLKKDFNERIKQTKGFAKKLGLVVLLKGPNDIITDGERVKINETGNPGMTKGGSGDVLAGLTAGLLAQHHNSFEVASAAAFINGSAGDLCFKEKRYYFYASNLQEKIPSILQPLLTL